MVCFGFGFVFGFGFIFVFVLVLCFLGLVWDWVDFGLSVWLGLSLGFEI